MSPAEPFLTPADVAAIAAAVVEQLAGRLAPQASAIDQEAAAKRVGLSAKTLSRLADQGEPVGRVRVGNRTLYVVSLLDEWLVERACDPSRSSPIREHGKQNDGRGVRTRAVAKTKDTPSCYIAPFAPPRAIGSSLHG